VGDDTMPGSIGQFLLYTTEDGHNRVEVRLEDGMLWLTQAAMAELFQTSPQNITQHIRAIYSTDELSEDRTCKDYLQVRTEGVRTVERLIRHYNLEMILAVGYRVRSHRGTQFRQWATERLREYVIKGFAMDDERLKEGRSLGVDYFDELLERIRDIRASEKRFYEKVRDLYALSIDYDPKAEASREFFAVVQNKLLFTVSGKTAPEIIVARADDTKPNMGLTSWKSAKVRRDDVTVAKNYLSQQEIDELNRIVVRYLDYAEDQARRGRALYMSDWREKLDAFLKFDERDILTNAGSVSAEVAKALATQKYDLFNQRRLAEEATQSAAATDAELKSIAQDIEGKTQQ
jgi:hypothetical protein